MVESAPDLVAGGGELSMGTTWLEVGGLSVHMPVTAGTNLVLALQCALCARGLTQASSPRGQWWGRFFAAMAVATAAGVLKHGFHHVLPGGAYTAVLWASSVTGGAAVHLAERAAIVAHTRGGTRRWLEWAAYGGTVAFLSTCLVTGPHIDVLIIYNAVGLTPVLAVEVWFAATRPSAGVGIAGGLMLAVFAGLVNGFRLTPGYGLTPVDVAHVLMGASFLSIYREAYAPPHVPCMADVGPSRVLTDVQV